MRKLAEVAEGVFVATSERVVTTSTVIAAGGSAAGGSGGGSGRGAGAEGGGGFGRPCLLVDPAVTPGEIAGLAAALRELGLVVVAGWSTHPHWDHVLWSAALGDVPRWATARCATVAAGELSSLVEGAQGSAPGHDLELLGRLTPLELDGGAISWDGRAIRVLRHDGHAPGHGALFVEDVAVLVAGDMCSDIEVPLLDLESFDPVGDYRSGVEMLASAGAAVVIPGHGTVGDSAELERRFALDRRYLADLEAGRPSSDPRLAAGPEWLRVEHARQVSWVARRAR